MKLIAFPCTLAYAALLPSVLLNVFCSNHNSQVPFTQSPKSSGHQQTQLTDSLIILDSLATILASGNDPSKELELEFFNRFPRDFKEFVAIYGYSQEENGIVLSEGYWLAEKHVLIAYGNLSHLDIIPLAQRDIDLLIGGVWQADAVNYLVSVITNRINQQKNEPIYFKLLKELSDQEQQSFWRIMFAMRDSVQNAPYPYSMSAKSYPRQYDIMIQEWTRSRDH